MRVGAGFFLDDRESEFMRLRHAGLLAAAFAAGLLAVAGATRLGGANEGQGARSAAAPVVTSRDSVGSAAAWATRKQKGSVRLEGQIPRAVVERATPVVRHHASSDELTLRFAFPLRDKAGLDRLIAQEAKTHRYLTRPQLYARFSPPQAQVNELRRWLVNNGEGSYAAVRELLEAELGGELYHEPPALA